MMYRILFLITVILLLQTTSQAQNYLEVEVAGHIEQIKIVSGTSDGLFEKLPTTSDKNSSVSKLIGLGMDVVPFLTPYLTDDSLTQAFVRGGKRDRNAKRQIAVNEYVIFVIRKITDYET